jgi:type IV secretion system protein VirB6
MEHLLTNIDSIILGFVQGSFGGVSGTIHTLWQLMFILFLAVYGYKVIISGQFLVSDLIGHCLKIVLILVLATEWGTFFQFIYRIVTELPSDMAGQIMQAASTSLGTHSQASDVTSANAALSSFFDRGMTIADKILEGAKWNDFGLFFYAAVVWAATIGLTSYAAYLIIFAKMGMAIFLALGPYFILMLVFNNSRALFDGWLKNLLNFSFTQLFVYVLLALLLAIMETPLKTLEAHSGITDKLVSVIGPFFLTSVVAILLLAQVRSITSSVVGGVTLSFMGSDAWTMDKAKASTGAATGGGLKKIAPSREKVKEYAAKKYEQGKTSLNEALKRHRTPETR